MSLDRVGVVAWRIHGGRLQVVLVRNLNGDRWILPKGRLTRGLSKREVALLEAWEEAGVSGYMSPRKGLDVQIQRMGCAVRLRLYEVRILGLAKRWPERDKRARKLVTARRARSLLSDPGMILAVKTLEQRMVRGGRRSARFPGGDLST